MIEPLLNFLQANSNTIFMVAAITWLLYFTIKVLGILITTPFSLMVSIAEYDERKKERD